jgi:hypothetical protein
VEDPVPAALVRAVSQAPRKLPEIRQPAARSLPCSALVEEPVGRCAPRGAGRLRAACALGWLGLLAPACGGDGASAGDGGGVLEGGGAAGGAGGAAPADAGASATGGRGGTGGTSDASAAADAAAVGRDGAAAGDAPAADAPVAADAAGPASFLPDFRSGTRLRAQRFAAPGADGAFATFVDMQNGQRCSFLPAADGVLRCLPNGSRFHAGFADAGCSLPVVGADFESAFCAAIPTIAAILRSSQGAEIYDVFKLAAYPPGGVPYVGTPGSCVPNAPLRTGWRTFLKAIEAVPAAGFVKGEVKLFPGPGGVSVKRIVAEDGASLATGLALTDRGLACEPLPAADGSVRCVATAPRAELYDGTFFLDAQCMTPLASVRGEETPVIGVHPDTAGRYSFFTPGERIKGTLYLNTQPGGCKTQPHPAEATRLRFYPVGAAVPASALPELRLARGMGSGSLALRYTAAADGTPLTANVLPVPRFGLTDDNPFLDTASNQPCYPVVTPGGPRCLPQRTLAMEQYLFFAEPECKGAILAGCDQGEDCTGRLAARLGRCGPTRAAETLARASARYRGAQYYQYQPGEPEAERCTLSPITNPPEGNLFVVGDSVAWDALPALTLTTE